METTAKRSVQRLRGQLETNRLLRLFLVHSLGTSHRECSFVINSDEVLTESVHYLELILTKLLNVLIRETLSTFLIDFSIRVYQMFAPH